MIHKVLSWSLIRHILKHTDQLSVHFRQYLFISYFISRRIFVLLSILLQDTKDLNRRDHKSIFISLEPPHDHTFIQLEYYYSIAILLVDLVEPIVRKCNHYYYFTNMDDSHPTKFILGTNYTLNDLHNVSTNSKSVSFELLTTIHTLNLPPLW